MISARRPEIVCAPILSDRQPPGFLRTRAGLPSRLPAAYLRPIFSVRFLHRHFVYSVPNGVCRRFFSADLVSSFYSAFFFCFISMPSVCSSSNVPFSPTEVAVGCVLSAPSVM